MVIYPFNAPIIMTDSIFVLYGGEVGTTTVPARASSFWLAEMQASAYIGTLLLPQVITGTYGYMGTHRIATDYGYVHQVLSVNIQSKQAGIDCTLRDNDGCVFIWNDTFGYLDFRQATSFCGCGGGTNPYLINIAYQAGLPTGTANQPGILEALTILAQIDLNEKFPGNAGMNEGVGDIGIQEFRSLDYAEKRGAHSLVKTALGESAKSMRAKRLIDMSIKKARRVLFA